MSIAAERARLHEDAQRTKNWKRWGTYLSERQWGTVREDYSADGSAWDYLPHDQARSRAYRWGEDGILGFCDRECRLCFALAMWNGRDAILKERLFGLSGPEGNHGEDVKELYYYLDATPTYAYAKGLYKYPQAAFPYGRLVEENRRRGKSEREFELADTGVFDDDRYFDVFVEYAKADDNDMLIRLTAVNRGPEAATLHLLPTLWFRNTWIWGCRHEGCTLKPVIRRHDESRLVTDHETLGKFTFEHGAGPDGTLPGVVFTENETNTQRLYGAATYTPYVKDAFHRWLVDGDASAVKPDAKGTKAAAHYVLQLPAGGEATVRLRLTRGEPGDKSRVVAKAFDAVLAARMAEADAFYASVMPAGLDEDQRLVSRQAYASLLWSKQFYHYVVEDWIDGDPAMPPPPRARKKGRNADWPHLFNRDVISMPDKWEYPWYAAWDLAFHMIPFAHLDPHFAKSQLCLFLREWYMHPNGQIPAYEWALCDVNPPVHAWAVWRVYKMTGPRGGRDIDFLASCFQKLLLNFTWWVNRKDQEGRHLFSGGFLGLDNVGVFDRSQPLPTGGYLQQADGTAWMAFYCGTMLSMALELARHGAGYEDMTSKFFEHFIHIADAINTLGGSGLWNEQDGFYYDQVRIGTTNTPLRVRSIVGLIPLLAVELFDRADFDALHGFRKRTRWFVQYRHDLAQYITYLEESAQQADQFLLAIPTKERLQRVLRYMLDESEFLSPFGIRSLSKVHEREPFVFRHDGREWTVRYVPGEGDTDLFGGNSNWRGPVWLPLNYLLVEALQRYALFYGDTLRVECPTGSGVMMTLDQVATELCRRMASLFTPAPAPAPGRDGVRPCFGADHPLAGRPSFRGQLEFHEFFHGETGRGLGAAHQTGWTALITRAHEELAPRTQA